MHRRGIAAIVLGGALLVGVGVVFLPPESDGDVVAVPTSSPSASPDSGGSGDEIQESSDTNSADQNDRLGYNQPNILEPTKLNKGEKPPQFVVVSFDGACKNELFQHYNDLAKRNDARFTYFLSALCWLPESKADLYEPPGKPVGSSDIGFADAKYIPKRVENLRTMWNEGNEIGTHFLGHFCDAQGVGSWDSADWRSEIKQFNRIIDDWQDITGITNKEALPFDSSIIRGGRTPCLMGQRDEMYPVFTANGYVYDASNSGSLSWPSKMKNGMWNLPLQTIKVDGYDKSVLSMDYNFMVAQNKGNKEASAAKCQAIEESTYRSFMNALDAVYNGNRAPFFIGNHFNEWVCGAYKNALTRFVDDAAKKYPEVVFGSNMDLIRWMELQDKSTLKKLRRLGTQTY